MAKALTQSYKKDLSDFDNNHPGPAWAKNNPATILQDPEFEKLNPNVPTSTKSGSPLAPLLTEDHSAVNQQVWAWIQSDKAARDWLAGKPDENGMVVNPNYNSDTVATATGPARAVGPPDRAVATAITHADGFTQKQVAAMYDKCARQIVNGVTYDP
ncbi:MAG: hypothetical protein J2P17_35390, partial [Mycobacterium sp.]|nr:hypothetical protein [Mycobacterium sp.]